MAGVIKGGPVDDGSILPGDVIIRFDGKDIADMRDLPRVVAESPVGKAVDVVIIRKGVEQTVKVTLGRLEDGEKLAEGEGKQPDEGAPVATAAVLGMTVAALDEEARAKFGISADVSGVVVTEVAEGSAAAERGIVAGEVITEIAQESVSSPQQVLDRINALKEQGRKNALLMLASKTGELRFVTVRMDCRGRGAGGGPASAPGGRGEVKGGGAGRSITRGRAMDGYRGWRRSPTVDRGSCSRQQARAASAT